ncbi:unnamed protein product [Rotaria sp. Silwood2]|nr:unnamed protein product [Rotaria sp. Silwood2]CAF2581233.1 unnamed protein product [Rotaria sp. Silwood2]CAF2840609.1 unnamed protein product [Rotaria sp. Silwood2]CAF3012562.1 unnamed protein product [Rotaria sp. Silwood2]CAF4023618.1 unnamed protein product [Rotaria sp. Silwood2]
MADIERGTNENRDPIESIPKPILAILGSIHCLVILCVTLIIPILEVAIGASYRDQCPINSNIPVYLIVTGACGMATIVLAVVIVAAFICCIKRNSIAVTFAMSCLVILIMLFIGLMSVFLFAWFIVGNVWIFGAKKDVQYDYPSSTSNYCHRTLYEFAFAILIITYVMPVVCCIGSCIRSCFQIQKTVEK